MEVIDVNIKPIYIYTSCWCNCVTGPVWTECVDCGEVRYIFPLGNIYIYIYIYIYNIRGSVGYSDTRCGG